MPRRSKVGTARVVDSDTQLRSVWPDACLPKWSPCSSNTSLSVVGLWLGHDSTIAFIRGGYIYWSEAYRIRQSEPSTKWAPILLTDYCISSVGIPGTTYWPFHPNTLKKWTTTSTKPLFQRARTGSGIRHHNGHAHHSFFDSPFESALVLTMDGGGDDGTFHIWRASRDSGICHVEDGDIHVGQWYLIIAYCIPDILSHVFGPEAEDPTWLARIPTTKFWGAPSDGSLLADYARTGNASESHGAIESMLSHVVLKDPYIRRHSWRPTIKRIANSIKTFRIDNPFSLLASLAHKVFVDIITNKLDDHGARKAPAISVGGGVAFNGIINAALQRHYGVPLHSPAFPGDMGLSIGAMRTSPQYARLPVRIYDNWITSVIILPPLVSLPLVLPSLARRLASGAVVAVVRKGEGRWMVGTPTIPVKNRILKILGKPWFGVAQVFATSFETNRLAGFESTPSNFCPFVRRAEITNATAGLLNQDGSGCIRTITTGILPWMLTLLQEVGGLTGAAALIAMGFSGNAFQAPRHSLDQLFTLGVDYVALHNVLVINGSITSDFS
eukprot:NODE_1377_length_1761_cov_71.807082_g1308_i0.p1 GENE.NODE_1377_length_1761_cov_71.807082_g1308_i0~~NODE_1377_length_1761_cov_71.807082_g1308_i0.p1  ORF type:complete len:555 (+),score=22.20 NODE_1377_length_1761_cov_71.807082_g1308_i0:53-1717(+)